MNPPGPPIVVRIIGAEPVAVDNFVGSSASEGGSVVAGAVGCKLCAELLPASVGAPPDCELMLLFLIGVVPVGILWDVLIPKDVEGDDAGGLRGTDD